MVVNKVAHHQVEVYPVLTAGVADRLERENLEGTSSVADPDFYEFRQDDLPEPLIRLLRNPQFRLDRSVASIIQHFEKRVSQMFVQAVVCYGREGFRFREGHTIHQALSAHHLNIGPNEKVRMAGAHSATIPSLYVYNEHTDQEHVFLYRSGIYDESNATIDVLEKINQADSAIDWLDQTNSLRTKAVALLNQAAKGELTPVQVSQQFALQLMETIDGAIEKATDEEIKAVLQLYREQAERLWSYVDCPEHIDRWLNLNLNDPILESARGMQVDKRAILQLVKAKIEQLPPLIHQERHQKCNESRAPAHFYDLFYKTIYTKLNGQETKLVEEATGIDSAALAIKAQAFKRTQTSTRLLEQHAAKIDALIADLRPLLNGSSRQFLTTTCDKKVSLRPGIYRLRYRMIKEDQEAQSVIKTKIESIWHQVQRNTSGAHLEAFFQQSLLALAPDEKMRKMFCKLMSISQADLDQRIQEIKVNQHAHAAIQKHQFVIGGLVKHIHTFSQNPSLAEKNKITKMIKDVLNQIQSSSKAKSIDILFYRRLFNFAETPAKKAIVAELIGKTEQAVDQAIAQKSKVCSVEARIKNHQTKIEEIMKVAKEAIQKLTAATTTFHHELMVELRQSFGMKQAHFREVYLKKFPDFPMSAGTLSHIETGKKKIDKTLIGHISSIFGVSPDLFHPSHFADS